MGDTLHESMSSALSDLGIDPNSLDADSDFEAQADDTEVEASGDNEEVTSQDHVEGQDEETVAPEGEETKEVTEAPAAEEPKLTAKEFQELNAAREELALKEKAFTERIAAQEKEFQEKYLEKVKTHDQIDDFFAHLANKDPELFDLIKGEFQEHQKQYSNPVLAQTRQEIQDLKAKLDQFTSKASDEVTRTKLDAEINQVKASLGKEAEAAGVKIDWAKVEDTWADNPKLNIESAVFALYGASIMKAAASKAKVEAVTKKVEARPSVPTAGAVSRSNTPAKEKVPSDAYDAVRYFARQLTGKA